MDADSDSRTEAIISQFKSLPVQSRRAVYHGIMNELRLNEWREVINRASLMSFQCDILGNLPIEIAALVAGHMDMADMTRLQRVSRRWQQVLTSAPARLAAIRANMGQSALASIDHGARNTTHDPLLSLIKRRLRVELAEPTLTVQLSCPLTFSYEYRMDARIAGYSNGICAWLDRADDRTSLILLNLESQKRTQLTTENRENLYELRMSNRLVTAVSTRAYCHVWDVLTHDYKSFRIPSQHFKHFLTNERNVAFSFDDSIVHWRFDEGLARTVPVGTNIALLALHPSEDEFAVTRFCAWDAEEEGDGSTKAFSPISPNAVLARKYYLLTERFALDDAGVFHSAFSHEQEFPLQRLTDYEWLSTRWHYHEIHRGQSTAVMYGQGGLFTARSDGFSRNDRGRLYLSLGPTNDRVAINILPGFSTHPPTISCIDPGVLYAISDDLRGMVIMKARTVDSPSPAHLWYQHKVKGQEEDYEECLWIIGDNKFVVLFYDEDILVWVLDEAIPKDSSQDS